jgi:hypothetical protein
MRMPIVTRRPTNEHPRAPRVDALRRCFDLRVEWAESVTGLKSARVYVPPGFSHVIENPDAQLTRRAPPRRAHRVTCNVRKAVTRLDRGPGALTESAQKPHATSTTR